jgi:SAM-dependent methyltransferase
VDEYTATTRGWLDRRFRAVDADGIYRAHQPIYGFRRGPTEPGLVRRYTITWRILRALAGLDFETFADIGGAEGYKAALVRELFDVDVTSCDLSEEACRRAREIYGVEARGIDIHALPFADGEFDVVLCSETLEHVPDIEGATRELLRIARRAVVITVPHEPPSVVERNIRENIPHAHIHSLQLRSFDHLRAAGYSVRTEPMLSPLLYVPSVLADGIERRPAGRASLAVRAYNAVCPVLRRLVGPRAVRALLRLDSLASRRPLYGGMLVTITKDPSCVRTTPRRRIRPADVLDFAVPLHRLTPGAGSERQLPGAATRATCERRVAGPGS